MPKKTAKNSAKLAPPSPRSGVRLPLGAHPENSGGKKGRSGRKPLAFKEQCAALLIDRRVLRATVAVLRDADHPQRAATLRLVADYGGEMVPQELAISVRDERAALWESLIPDVRRAIRPR